MSGVKWIKITTGMFEDEKINFIESLPESDAILIIWIKLLTQAGKSNANGFIFLTEQIPYTDEMLAHKFRKPLTVVKLALETLKRLDMVCYDNEGFLAISNWEKHQNIDGLDKIREQNRVRQAKYRDKQKALPDSNVTHNVTVTPGNGTDIELELDTKDSAYTVFVNEIVLKLYPGRKVKSTRDKKLPKILKKHSEEEITRSINRYTKEVKGSDQQFILNESTFWNGRYIDYLDDNYEDAKGNEQDPYAGVELF